MNFSSDEQEDTGVLKNTVDNLEFQLKNAREQIQTLNHQIEGLRLVVNATCIYTTDVEETAL